MAEVSPERTAGVNSENICPGLASSGASYIIPVKDGETADAILEANGVLKSENLGPGGRLRVAVRRRRRLIGKQSENPRSFALPLPVAALLFCAQHGIRFREQCFFN